MKAVLYSAIKRAIDEVGLDAFRRTSLFASNERSEGNGG